MTLLLDKKDDEILPYISNRNIKKIIKIPHYTVIDSQIYAMFNSLFQNPYHYKSIWHLNLPCPKINGKCQHKECPFNGEGSVYDEFNKMKSLLYGISDRNIIFSDYKEKEEVDEIFNLIWSYNSINNYNIDNINKIQKTEEEEEVVVVEESKSEINNNIVIHKNDHIIIETILNINFDIFISKHKIRYRERLCCSYMNSRRCIYSNCIRAHSISDFIRPFYICKVMKYFLQDTKNKNNFQQKVQNISRNITICCSYWNILYSIIIDENDKLPFIQKRCYQCNTINKINIY
jgi:hypothetical protein